MFETVKAALSSKPMEISEADRARVYQFVREHPNSTTKATYEGVDLRTAMVIAILKAGEQSGELMVTPGAHGAKVYSMARHLPDGETVGDTSGDMRVACPGLDLSALLAPGINAASSQVIAAPLPELSQVVPELETQAPLMLEPVAKSETSPSVAPEPTPIPASAHAPSVVPNPYAENEFQWSARMVREQHERDIAAAQASTVTPSLNPPVPPEPQPVDPMEDWKIRTANRRQASPGAFIVR